MILHVALIIFLGVLLHLVRHSAALPLLVLAALIASGIDGLTSLLQKARRLDVWVARAAAVVFLLVGVRETVLYWLL